MNRLNQSVPKIDLQGRRQRFLKRLNMNKPSNLLERCIFNIFEFSVVFPIIGLTFLLEDGFRERVYYLYEHPDHDDHLCLYPYLKYRHPYTTRWIVYLFPKVKRTWQKYLQLSRALKALLPTYKSSPPMLGLTPKLAVVVHGAGEWAEDFKIPNGCVMGLFFPMFGTVLIFLLLPFPRSFVLDSVTTRAAIGVSGFIIHLASKMEDIKIIPSSCLYLLWICPSLAQVLTWIRYTRNGGSSLLR